MTLTSTSELIMRLEAGRDAAPEELDLLTRRLRRELLQLDITNVRRCVGEDVPAGAKGFDLGQTGSLLVTLATTPGVLRSVVELVRDWLGRNDVRKVHLVIGKREIDVTGISSAQQERLIESWIWSSLAAE